MKSIFKTSMVVSVAALGLSLAACDSAAENQAEDQIEATEEAADAEIALNAELLGRPVPRSWSRSDTASRQGPASACPTRGTICAAALPAAPSRERSRSHPTQPPGESSRVR